MLARFNRLAHLVLAFSLLSPIAAVDARTYAQPPSAGAVAAVDAEPARPAEDHLVAPPSRDEVRKALAARRDHNVASFRAYRKAGIYPHNFVRPGPLNVWRDRDGHLCAAATMLDKDGQHEIVLKTAETNVNIRLLDVTTGPLMDWMLTSGLTIEEIDRIQAPAVMPTPMPEPQINTAAEDARLRKDYEATDTFLGKHAKAGLDVATDRLMQNPELARRLVGADHPAT